ncbi:MAG: hypothetical protein ABI679_06580 [Gemmatimonadota bacterium]
MNPSVRPKGITALALFFAFGTLMSGIAALALAWPGGPLDIMWRANPAAREGFASIGPWAVLLMLVVGAGCAAAAYGLWRLHSWGRYLAMAVLAINMIGDTANAIVRKDLKTMAGVVIGGVFVGYLAKSSTKKAFPVS